MHTEKTKLPFKSLSWGSVGAVALMGAIMGGCSFLPKEEPVLAPPLVEPAQMDYDTAEVTNGEIVKRVKGSGVLVPKSQHDLFYTKDGGRLQKVFVVKGDLVEKGDTLAEIETGSLIFDIDQARIELKKAEIRLEQLRAENADKYSIEIGKLDVQSLNNRLYQMNSQLAEAKITAPMNGVVTFVSEIRQGETVPAYESIFQVAETSDFHVEYTAINAADIAEVTGGMEAIVDLKGKDLKGKVIQTPKDVPQDIYQKDPDHYSKTIVVSIDSWPKDVKVGEIAGIEIITAKNADTLIIPKNGLRTTNGRNYVQVMADNTKREVDIEAGIISATEAEVLKGLNEGDIIILK